MVGPIDLWFSPCPQFPNFQGQHISLCASLIAYCQVWIPLPQGWKQSLALPKWIDHHRSLSSPYFAVMFTCKNQRWTSAFCQEEHQRLGRILLWVRPDPLPSSRHWENGVSINGGDPEMDGLKGIHSYGPMDDDWGSPISGKLQMNDFDINPISTRWYNELEYSMFFCLVIHHTPSIIYSICNQQLVYIYIYLSWSK